VKGWIATLMLIFCGSAAAADWVVVHTAPEGDQYFYDASKLAISGNEITYWKKVTFKTPYSYKGQQVASALYRERIHCSEHTLKPLTHIVHAVSGAVIEHLAAIEAEAAAIIPETIGDVFEQSLCTLVKVKREEEMHKAPVDKEKSEPPAPQNYNGSQPPPSGTL